MFLTETIDVYPETQTKPSRHYVVKSTVYNVNVGGAFIYSVLKVYLF